MHPPPPSAVLSRLVEQVVDYLSIAKYTLVMHLESGDWIEITAPFEVFGGDVDLRRRAFEFPLVEVPLLGLIGASIIDVSAGAENTLEISFQGGSRIRILNLPAYDSFAVSIAGVSYQC